MGEGPQEKYGATRVSKIRDAFNELRAAVRSGDIEAAEKALDRYEPWADFIFDRRHKKESAVKKMYRDEIAPVKVK